MLNIGLSMESPNEIPVNIKIINECKTVITLSETLINPITKLENMLTSERLTKVINIKITIVVIVLKGIKMANIIYSKSIETKVVSRGLSVMFSLIFTMAH